MPLPLSGSATFSIVARQTDEQLSLNRHEITARFSSNYGILTKWNRSSSSRATAPGSSTWTIRGFGDSSKARIITPRRPPNGRRAMGWRSTLCRNPSLCSSIRRAPDCCAAGATSSTARNAAVKPPRSSPFGISAPPFAAEHRPAGNDDTSRSEIFSRYPCRKSTFSRYSGVGAHRAVGGPPRVAHHS